MPKRTKHISEYATVVRSNTKCTPIYCRACGKKIEPGQRYHVKRGDETHTECV